MFKNPVESCTRGDRLGMCRRSRCERLERGFICEPVRADFQRGGGERSKIRFLKSAVKCGSKFHVTIGHTTVMATALFQDVPKDGTTPPALEKVRLADGAFDSSKEYKYEELHRSRSADDHEEAGDLT